VDTVKCQVMISKIVAPVINDVSFRVMMIFKLIRGLQASIMDVETALSHGNQLAYGIHRYHDILMEVQKSWNSRSTWFHLQVVTK
jgi:hypothetical protein